ncbi:MAG TPA: phosphoribosylglycinamide formyltransferase [Longimicrobiales bacterium]|nr:phosphoribosylglycinamide formyltransferase [Longimicrobiales bacterium]
MTVRVAVFASGGGTNLQALLDRFGGPMGPAGRVAEIVLVVSDREDAGALDRARAAAVPTRVIPVRGRAADDVARETLEVLEAAEVELIALAGYLRLVPTEVVRRYRGRIVNIHPSLLPAFGGKGMYGQRVHEAVLEAGCRVTGVTVHLVDEEYDTGPILAQWPVPVLEGDTPERLAARVLRTEHRLYPAVVETLAVELARGKADATARPGAYAGPDPRCFTVDERDAPDAESVRRALGLDGSRSGCREPY